MRFKSCLLLLTIALLAINFPAHAAEKIVIPKQAVAIYTPDPKYPFFALMRREEGSGIFVFRVDIKSGRVKQVVVAQSTGHQDLDSAAVKAFKQWRFKPGVLPPIKKILPQSKDPLASKDSLAKIPVTFTIHR